MKLRIKELREEFGLSQKELADRISNMQRNVSNWENGASEPDCETIVKLADLFDITLDELFGREKFAGEEGYTADGEESRNLLRILRLLTAGQRAALINLIKAFGK